MLPTLVGADRPRTAPRRGIRLAASRRPDCLAARLDLATSRARLLRCDDAAAEQTRISDSATTISTRSLGRCSPSPRDDVVGALDGALDAGATPEQLARAVAYAAALRIVRFHTQNDHGDWNVVHHAFTAANALHQSMVRAPSPELIRGVYQCALRVYLDRFLNVPAARLPSTYRRAGRLAALATCWDTEGKVDEAGGNRLPAAHRRRSGARCRPETVIAALGRQLLTEDAGFHWYQILEASIRQFAAWPAGSDQGALIMAGTARFLAAHTPTRRELSHVVHIATRLRRGEPLYEEDVDVTRPGAGSSRTAAIRKRSCCRSAAGASWTT